MNMLCCLLVLFFKEITKTGLNVHLFNVMSRVVCDVLDSILYSVVGNAPLKVRCLICIGDRYIDTAICVKMMEVEKSLWPLSAVMAQNGMMFNRNDIVLLPFS
jgi:hypothetical protein